MVTRSFCGATSFNSAAARRSRTPAGSSPRYVDAIVVRTFGQDRLERLADAASVPVVNALSDFSHPCQCLADLQTIREKKGDLAAVALAYVGDGNNVAHSLMFGGAKLGMDVRVRHARRVTSRSPGRSIAAGRSRPRRAARLTVTNVVAEAAVGADVLYTDVWASMGQEDGVRDARRRSSLATRSTRSVVDMADSEVIVMHCLPAHRGDEITADVLDGPRSIVWDQAENRLHAQKALLAWLLD